MAGGRGVGAVGAAVFNAVGYRAHKLPIRPNEIFNHLKKLKKSEAGLTKTWGKNGR